MFSSARREPSPELSETGACVRNKAVIVAPPLAYDLSMALSLCGGPGHLSEYSQFQHSALPLCQAVSHSQQLSSPGLLSKPHAPALSPCPYLWTCVSGLVQGVCMDPLCMSHSVLDATDQLLCFPLSSRSYFPVPACLSTGEGTPPKCYNSPLLLLPRGQVPSHFYLCFFL